MSVGLLEKSRARQNRNNCVSVTVVLEKSFLRDGRFAEMTLRIMDEWTSRQLVPRYSKFPIGSCVATSFGIGVLVGWRFQDDCHVVRSLWQKRGTGSALAYLNRSAIHCIMEAPVGFHVETSLGYGFVVAYVNGGEEFNSGKYFVRIMQRGRHKGITLAFNRADILSCKAAPFIPIIEQIREAAQYQIQIDMYKSALQQRLLHSPHRVSILSNTDLWKAWAHGIDLFVSSLVKAIEEDENFDIEMDKFVSSVIDFLEHLGDERDTAPTANATDNEMPLITLESKHDKIAESSQLDSREDDNDSTAGTKRNNANPSNSSGTTAGFWSLGDLFGGVGGLFPPITKVHSNDAEVPSLPNADSNLSFANSNQRSSPVGKQQSTSTSGSHQTAFAVIKTIMRTVAIARASIPDHPKIQMALSILNEVLLFIRAIIKVQQKNMSKKSLDVWKRTFKDITDTFGPIKQRLATIGLGIAERLEKQGNQAKIRVLRFVDIIIVDDRLLQSIELRDWRQCISRLENAAVRANMIDAESCAQCHKSIVTIYNTLAPRNSESDEAAARNEEKFAQFAKALKWMATPKRSFLNFFTRDDVFDVVERILVRVFQKEKEASQMLSIYASQFHTLRHLRMLNNRAITGKLWKPLLDAADEEFAWAVSRMPKNTKVFTEPISKLFSLGVAKFHQMGPSNSNNDWLDFLMEEEAIKIIQEVDKKAQESLRNFYNDVKKVTAIMPYYSSIDNDFLNLLDEVELDKILKDAVEALADTHKFAQFVREKSSIVLHRFLEYLPKMSIPVDKRDLGDGWVLTCTGKLGSDLRLADMHFEKENLVCQVMGGGNVFSPMFGGETHNDQQISSTSFSCSSPFCVDETGNVEVSILDHIRELVANAQRDGCWSMESTSTSRKTLDGLPVSEVLGCAIELWQNHEIDDDGLLEIAIKDIAYHIQMQTTEKQPTKGRSSFQPDANSSSSETTSLDIDVSDSNVGTNSGLSWPPKRGYDEMGPHKNRFNPRKDPTVLYLDITKLTFNLDDFLFRVERAKPLTIFDPVFEGVGSLTIKNVSLRLRIECRKEHLNRPDGEIEVPVMQLKELAVQLEKVKVDFKDTGADWLLNQVIKGFCEQITKIVKTSLKEVMNTQIHDVLEQMNEHIEANPELMLKLLGITIDDLEENTVLV
uniref:Uncharacterized protein n=1 Tax=Ditylum brightwellii TaxID=49249 RepID=A0A7S2A1I7_9STRA